MPHKIKDVEVFSSVHRTENNTVYDSSYVMKLSGENVVRVTTDDGYEGYGMTFSDPIGEYVDKILKDEVIGRDILAYEDCWNAMYIQTRSSGRKGLALLAMSAIDIAIWDARGKVLGQPVYKLLGGTKRKIPAYASIGFLSMPVEEMVEKSLEAIKDGYKTLKIKVGYDMGNNIRADYDRVLSAREAVGSEIELIIDANGIYDAASAIRLATMVEELNISLFEEPTHADDIDGLARVRRMTKIPVASGENEYTKYGCRDLLRAEAVDVMQFDITRTGGFTEMMKVAALTQAWNIKLAPHFWPQFSAHILSAVSNGLYLETFPSDKNAPKNKQAIKNQPPVINGYYELLEAPGLGLEFDIDYLTSFKKSY